MSGSVSFDRAARVYDRTRGMSAEAREQVGDMLAAELNGRGRALEVGVGTGRIALPLHERGVALAGIDLSEAMLRQLIENAGATGPFPLARADATRLPFPDETFGASIACHVFHLIPDWPAAIAEMIRVVRPGGVVLVDSGNPWAHPIYKQILLRLCATLGISRRFPGLDRSAGDPADAAERVFAEAGCGQRSLPKIVSRSEFTVAETLGQFRDRIWSWTWNLSDDDIERASREVLRWAKAEHGDPEQPHTSNYAIRWKAFDLPE